MEHIVIVISAALFAALAVNTAMKNLFVKEIVFEFERGLMYRDGKFQKSLEPGTYWFFKFNTRVMKVDIRPKFTIVPSQELMTADNLPVKISLALHSRVVDPVAAINQIDNFWGALYTVAQLALREIVTTQKIDELMISRDAVAEALRESIAPKAAEFGVELISANIRDIMVPGELKKVLSQVVKAQKESQAALEKARGETAALRSLANAARMIESSPALMQLRLLQSIGERTGNTIVYGVPTNGAAVHAATSTKAAPDKTDQE